MKTNNDFSELVEAGIIDADTADKIEGFYQKKADAAPNRLFLVFAILGALLVGLGIILIVAHNWDNMSRSIKTTLSFIPVIIGQIACGYALFKRMESPAWREGSALFLFFAVGACISLVSQIYHIEGNTAVFVVSWVVLCLPLVYLLRSSAVALLYILGITFYALTIQREAIGHWSTHYYWLLFLLILPHYYFLYKNHPNGNTLNILHLFVPLSFLCTWSFVLEAQEIFILSGFASLLGVIYLIGHADFFKPQKANINVYIGIGSVGTVILLLICSYSDIWKELSLKEGVFADQMMSWSYVFTLGFTLLGIFLLYHNYKGKSLSSIKPVAWVFPLFFALIHLHFVFSHPAIIINLLLLALGVLTIREGALKNHLGILNYGLLIITCLITIRFFDTKISFVWRGVIFLVIGAGFFLLNNWMLRRRKNLSNLES